MFREVDDSAHGRPLSAPVLCSEREAQAAAMRDRVRDKTVLDIHILEIQSQEDSKDFK